MAFQNKVAAVEQVDLGICGVIAEHHGASGSEDLIVAAPHGQHRNAAVAQVGVQLGVQGQIVGVVGEQLQLYEVITRVETPERDRGTRCPD